MYPNHVKTRIIYSRSFDPWYNLSMEEYLLNHVNDGEIILYLWQNENTVVIGRNQNPWKECRCKNLEKDGGKLARRLSGGGAVYHDLGNLNFTFFMKQDLYNVDKQLSIILDAVKKIGINAEFSGRNDLTVEGRKFSGNAFCEKGETCYHHGTILVDTDINKLTKYLQISKDKILSKGINSIHSRVINLKSMASSLTIQKIKENIIKSFKDFYGESSEEIKLNRDNEVLLELYKKYSSWEWIYGETPIFDMTFQHRFLWGNIDMGLSLKSGVIKSAVIYSDAMDSNLIKRIALSLKGIDFSTKDIISALENLAVNEKDMIIIYDIKKWLLTKL